MLQRINQSTWLAYLLPLTLMACGCGAESSKTRLDKPPVTDIDEDDVGMNQAIDKARLTVDQFIAVLQNPNDGQSKFSVKMPVRDDKTTEHMWLSNVRFSDGRFSGDLNNEPVKVSGVKIGDTLSVAKDEISDWMYMQDSKIVGGYSIRYLMNREAENDEEKAMIDNMFTE